MSDIVHFTPSAYESCIKLSEVKPQITKRQKENALKKIFNENVEVLAGNYAWLTGSKEKIHFYVGTKTEGAKIPFYAISQNTLDKMECEKCEKIVCLFFVDNISAYTVYYRVWNRSDITKEPWVMSTGTGKTRTMYRWNLNKDYDDKDNGGMEKTEHGVQKGLS